MWYGGLIQSMTASSSWQSQGTDSLLEPLEGIHAADASVSILNSDFRPLEL